jgi:hypothetical protein
LSSVRFLDAWNSAHQPPPGFAARPIHQAATAGWRRPGG